MPSVGLKMNVDGWTLDVHYLQGRSFYKRMYKQCSDDNSWYGFKLGPSEGSIKTTLYGCGKAELDFGECSSEYVAYEPYYNYTSHFIQVNLNGNEIGRANPKKLSKKIKFDFKEGDVLELHDRGYAMIIFNNFTILSCC